MTWQRMVLIPHWNTKAAIKDNQQPKCETPPLAQHFSPAPDHQRYCAWISGQYFLGKSPHGVCSEVSPGGSTSMFQNKHGFGSFIRCQNHSKPTKHTKEIKKADYICFSDFLLSNSKSVESCSSCQVAVRFPDGLLLPVQAIMHRVGGLMFCVWLVTAMSMHQSARERDEMWWCSNVANADYAYLSVSQWTPVLAERHHPSHASRNLRSEKRRMQSLWSIKVLWSLLQEQQAPRFLVNLFVHIHFEGCLSSQLTEFTLLRQEILEMFHFRWGWWRFKTRSQPLFRLQWLQETLHKSQFFLLQCSEAAICLPCQSREEKTLLPIHIALDNPQQFMAAFGRASKHGSSAATRPARAVTGGLGSQPMVSCEVQSTPPTSPKQSTSSL